MAMLYEKATERIPPEALKVAIKLPPKYGADKFFILLEDGAKSMLPNEHYWRFDAGDYLIVDGVTRGEWTYINALLAYAAAYPAEEKSFELEYVSKPRQIADGWLYMAHLGDRWLHISYDLAAAYFTRGDGRGSYYQVLGVKRSVTQDQIKQAYRAMMRRYHPDVYHGQDANQIAQRINEAYDTLSDPEARRQYDNMGQPGSDPEIKRWPGNGFGTLTAVAEKRSETWIVRKVLGFERRKRVQTFVVPREDVGNRRIHVKAVGRHVAIEGRPESFGSARVSFVEDARGGWSRERNQPWVTWEEKEIRVEWEV